MKVKVYRYEWDSYVEDNLDLLAALLTIGKALEDGAVKVEVEP